MATLKVVNLDNTEAGSIDLHDKIALAPLNPFVVKDAVVAHMAALRSGNHKTKTRSEVAGSRIKLFRQKGTGRARVGSAQSPVRRHGGTVFGPVKRDHSIKLNKKVKKLALASVVGEKIRNKALMVVESLALEDHKTKTLAKLVEKWGYSSALLVCSEENVNLELAARNLGNVKVVHVTGLNVYDVLKFDNVVLEKGALSELEKRLV